MSSSRNRVRAAALAAASVAAATLIAGCGGTGAAPAGQISVRPTSPGASASALSHGGPVMDQVSLIDTLRARGLDVGITGAVQRPFLKARGTRLQLTGRGLTRAAMVEAYNYDSTDLGTDGSAVAQQDAAGVPPSGVPTIGPDLTGPRHLYRADRVVLLYNGADPVVTGLLTEVLGRQFAGT